MTARYLRAALIAWSSVLFAQTAHALMGSLYRINDFSLMFIKQRHKRTEHTLVYFGAEPLQDRLFKFNEIFLQFFHILFTA